MIIFISVDKENIQFCEVQEIFFNKLFLRWNLHKNCKDFRLVVSRLVACKMLFFRPDLMPLDDCKLLFVNEIFDIEKPGTQVNEFDEAFDASASPVKRKFMSV